MFARMKQFLAGCAAILLVVASQAADSFKVSEFTFATPDGWKKLPGSSSMRAAELKTGEGKDAADVVFFYFGPGGAGSMTRVGTPVVPSRTVHTRVPGLCPGRTSLTSKPSAARRRAAASASANR